MWTWLRRNRRGLTYALVTCWFVSQVVHAIADYKQYSDEQRHASEPVTASGYAWHLLDEIAENWQSEFLQVLAFVVLSAHLIHEGSPQSKDGDERLERKIDELTADVAALRFLLLQVTRAVRHE